MAFGGKKIVLGKKQSVLIDFLCRVNGRVSIWKSLSAIWSAGVFTHVERDTLQRTRINTRTFEHIHEGETVFSYRPFSQSLWYLRKTTFKFFSCLLLNPLSTSGNKTGFLYIHLYILYCWETHNNASSIRVVATRFQLQLIQYMYIYSIWLLISSGKAQKDPKRG